MLSFGKLGSFGLRFLFMETALYLLPVTLGDTPVENVLPSYNRLVISQIKFFIVEDVRSARRFLKKVDNSISIVWFFIR